MATKKIEFEPLPNSVPEGTQVGGMFSLVCDFELQDSGRVCLKKMGEVESDYDEKDDKSMIRPNMDDEIKAMQSSMMSDGTSGGMGSSGGY